MSRKIVTYHEVPALWGAGAMGHTWCTVKHYPDGTKLCCQTSSGSDAVRMEEIDPKTGEPFPAITPYTIYTRAGKGWREVSRSAAVLDGNAFEKVSAA